MKNVLDTNTLIYFFKEVVKVKNRLLSIPPSEIALLTIVLFEMEFGIAKSSSPRKKISQLKDFTSLENIIPFGPAEAKTGAQIQAKLEKKAFQSNRVIYLLRPVQWRMTSYWSPTM